MFVLISLDFAVYETLNNMIVANEGRSLSEVVRELLDTQLQQRRHTQMAEAARFLKDDYENNAELTEFTVLDGEEFSNS